MPCTSLRRVRSTFSAQVEEVLGLTAIVEKKTKEQTDTILQVSPKVGLGKQLLYAIRQR